MHFQAENQAPEHISDKPQHNNAFRNDETAGLVTKLLTLPKPDPDNQQCRHEPDRLESGARYALGQQE